MQARTPDPPYPKADLSPGPPNSNGIARSVANPVPSLTDVPPRSPPAGGAAAPAVPPGFGNPSAGLSPSSTRGPHHRRAQSELAFRISEELDLGSGDPLSSGFDEIGSEDDLFCTYMDVEKMGCREEECGSGSLGNGSWGDRAEAGSRMSLQPGGTEVGQGDNAVRAGAVSVALTASTVSRPKHRYSNSVDGSVLFSSALTKAEGPFGEVAEAKKAMPPDKLAELAAIDPKRAKR